jgi:hypothetical protein
MFIKREVVTPSSIVEHAQLTKIHEVKAPEPVTMTTAFRKREQTATQ